MQTSNDFTYKVEKSGEATIEKYVGDCEIITVPSNIDGHPVTALTTFAFSTFSNSHHLKKVTLSDNLKAISSHAFSGCNILEEVVIPKSVTEIGNSAFENCSLKSVNIPTGVTKIGFRAFSNCSALTSFDIPEGVKNIQQETFRNCLSLTSIFIPSSVTDVCLSAFYGCKSLESIVVDEGNAYYCSMDGVLLDRKENKRIFTPRVLLLNRTKSTIDPGTMTDKEIISEISMEIGVDYEAKSEIWEYGFCGDGPLLEVAFEGDSVIQLGSIFMTNQALELCAHLHSLKVLNICYSEVDIFPEALCKLSKLEFLNLYHTKIKELPENFGELVSLKRLELGGTVIKKLPESACNLSRLKSLRVQHSKFRKFPDNIGKLTNLESIDFHGSNVEELPESLANCAKLRSLWGWGAYGSGDESRIPEGVTENIIANFGTTSEMSSFQRLRVHCRNNEFVIQIVIENNKLVQIWNDYDRLLEVDDKSVRYYSGSYVEAYEDGKRYLCAKTPTSSGSRTMEDDENLVPSKRGTWIFLAKYGFEDSDNYKEVLESWIPQIYEFYCLDENYNVDYSVFYDKCKKEIER